MRRKPTAQQSLRSASRIFEYKGYWLGYEVGSGYVYYYWHDKAKGKVQRRSTGERELEAAKEYLIERLRGQAPDDPLHPGNVPISELEAYYFKHHANKIRAQNAARRAFKLVVDYIKFAEAPDDPRFQPMVGQFELSRQEAFMRWARDVHKLSAKTISTYLSTIKAALNIATTERVSENLRGENKAGRLLSSAPFINDNEIHVSVVTGLPRSTPRKDIPDLAEMARLLDACVGDEYEHVFRYAIMELNTWARPEAIFDLSVKSQVNFESGLIDLNPPGRIQNKKYRPLIPLTDNLRGWLLHWDRDKPLFRPKRPNMPIRNVDNRTLAKLRETAEVKATITKYTFRHFMATRIRNVPGIPVSREERGEWIGHKQRDFRVMQDFYESFDADFLTNAKRATDATIVKLDTLCTRSLRAPGVIPGTGLVVIQGGQPVGDIEAKKSSDGA